VFKLGGAAELPPLADAAPVPNPPPLRASEESVQRGARVYAQTCAQCHGQLAVGGVKDLRYMAPETHAAFDEIVLEGTLEERGMAGFASLLTEQDVEDVHAYLIARANEDWGR
jgi:quinohemoprotein ethanol dehydrogenase